MKVVDIRNIFSERNIELFDVNSSYIYYAEEKNEEGSNNLFILEYDRSTRRERLITNYTLEDPTFVEHLFAFEDTVILILENGTNSLWLIEIDKDSGAELNRRKVVCTGAFRACAALDSSHVLIYMGADEANREMFRQYREITGCECLCYMYDLETNAKYFVKNPLIAKLGASNIKTIDVHGVKYLILLDPFADEDIKKGYYDEQRWINVDIRDNIWLCNLTELENELAAGYEDITKKCIASADIKALARYMGIEGEKVYFRAKEFRTGLEKICSYDVFTNTLQIEAELSDPQNEKTFYIIEENPFSVFEVTTEKTETKVKGIVNSTADLKYNTDIGKFMTCIDNRYVVTQNTYFNGENGKTAPFCCIYDSANEASERYECNCFLSGDTLILY